MDVCLRVLKESNKSRFDSYSFRKSALIVSHYITFRDCRVHSFSRNSCIFFLCYNALAYEILARIKWRPFPDQLTWTK